MIQKTTSFLFHKREAMNYLNRLKYFKLRINFSNRKIIYVTIKSSMSLKNS